MYLGAQAWPDLAEYFEQESLAIVPLGSTEQHGPHLPLSTDHVIAEELARAAAERAGYLCTPTVNIGVSDHHRQFHGTLWVDPASFRDYIESMTRSLVGHGIDRVVYVNAHGGNVQHLREVGRRLHRDETAFCIEWMWDESIPDLLEELIDRHGPHGGPKETAMLQYLRPEWVHEDRTAEARDTGMPEFDAYVRGEISPGGRPPMVNGAQTFYDAIDNSENGVFGDQTEVSAADGERLFEAATDQLGALCDWLAATPWERLAPKDHI